MLAIRLVFSAALLHIINQAVRHIAALLLRQRFNGDAALDHIFDLKISAHINHQGLACDKLIDTLIAKRHLTATTNLSNRIRYVA